MAVAAPMAAALASLHADAAPPAPIHAAPASPPEPDEEGCPCAGAKSSCDTKRTRCDVCGQEGSNENLVRCDVCKKCFHFLCLLPPVKKSPKVAGYSWHCNDCDPSDRDSDWHLD